MAVLGGGACSSTPEHGVLIERWELPPHDDRISSIATFAHGRVAIGDGSQVWTQNPVTGQWDPIHIPAEAGCMGQSRIQMAALPDGRLGFLCHHGLQQQRPVKVLVAYDWQTQRLEQLFADPLIRGMYTWNPTMDLGVYADMRVDSYPILYWMTATTLEPIPITLVDGDHRWFMLDGIEPRRRWEQGDIRFDDQAHPTGLVHSPVWSPDGRSIVFAATLAPIGRPYSFSRIYPYNLYLLDPQTLQVDMLFANIDNPGGLSWSPDSRLVAYRSGRDGGQIQGLWVYDTQTRTNLLVQHGSFQASGWSADGASLYVIHCADSVCLETDALYRFDTQALTQ